MSKSSVFERQKDFENDFCVEDGQLMCRFCAHVVDHNRRSTIRDHINSKKHQSRKKRNDGQQVSLRTSFSVSDLKMDVIYDLVDSFAKADIPLEKVDKLRDFFSKHVKNGGAIPSADTIRKIYLARVFEEKCQKLLDNLFTEKRIAIIIDGTTDACSRHVFHIIFQWRQIIRLVEVEFLDATDHLTIANLVQRTLPKYNIGYNKPIMYVTDSAACMIKSYRDVLRPGMPQMVHNPCIAHIISLVASTWEDFDKFSDLARLITQIKNSFSKSTARRRRWNTFLEEHGVPEENRKLFPLHTVTRWSSWFQMVKFTYEHYNHMVRFFTQEHQVEAESAHVNRVVETFNTNLSQHILHIRLCFVAANSSQFLGDLNFFQKKNQPTSPFVYDRIQQLEAFLLHGNSIYEENEEVVNLDAATQALIAQYTYPAVPFAKEFKEAFVVAHAKFHKHIPHHPAMGLFKDVRVFNPRFMKLSVQHQNIRSYQCIPEFKDPSGDLLREWSLYVGVDLTTFVFEELETWWESVKVHLPLLYEISQDYIWLPVSSAEVERSFSRLSNILESDRQTMTPETVKKLTMMYYNR